MSTFPLHLETYRVGQRNYRRNPYAAEKTPINAGAFEDSPDLYGDEAADGPSCAVAPRVESLAPQTATMSRPKDDSCPKRKKEKRSHKEVEVSTESEDFVVCQEDSRVSCWNGKWKASIEVPPMLVCRLIGTRGAVLREMEDSTSCRVIIPHRGKKGPVEIRSIVSLDNVSRCLDRIEIILSEARKSSRFTHFVSIPCTDPEVMHNFEDFKKKILEMDSLPASAKDDELFQKSYKLHVTVNMLWIFDNVDEETAKTKLSEAGEKIKKAMHGKPLIAHIEGLAIMNDDPANTDVLYGVVKGEKLQVAVDLIAHLMKDANIAPEEEQSCADQHVKMHMTLMNSRFKAQSSHAKRHSFDATKILSEFGSFDFGSIPIKKISVCALHSSKDKYYDEICVVEL